MKVGIPNYKIALDDGNTIIRKARKEHRCSGGHDGEKRTRCDWPILKGQAYVEYYGEAPAYQNGYRYHVKCAAQQGLLEKLPVSLESPCAGCGKSPQTCTCEVPHGA